jgi:hypothetical protein
MVDVLAPPPQFGPRDLHGLSVDTATMFADYKGVHKPGIEKRQRKLLEKVAFLSDFLEEGERLLIIAKATSPFSVMEQLTTGWVLLQLKRCLLVFTDRRIFHVPTTSAFDYRESVAQIRYGDIDTIALKRSGLKIAYKSGGKERFLYVQRPERKKIKALLQKIDTSGMPSNARHRVHLCPSCRNELQDGRYECARCGFEFKNKSTAVKRSIWIPGGGYFYTGHPFLGMSDALVETMLILFVVFSAIAAVARPKQVFPGLAMVVLLLIFEKVITIYHANHFIKEYLPAHPKPVNRNSFVSTFKIAAFAVILLALGGLVVLGFLQDTGLAPSDRVVAAAEIPAQHRQSLVDAGIIAPDETIEYFYSGGILSVLESGNILTDRRVIVYDRTDKDSRINIYAISNQDIVSVEKVRPGDAMNYAVYRVMGRGEVNWLELWLPHEHGDADRFVAAVEKKITD